MKDTTTTTSEGSTQGTKKKMLNEAKAANLQPLLPRTSELSVPPVVGGIRAGRWSPEEKLLFLHGLNMFGRGRWKKIRTFLPTRSLVQIKSHAQKVLKRVETGEDIFIPLREKASVVKMLVAKQQAEKADGKPPSASPRFRPLPKPRLCPRPAKKPEKPPAVQFAIKDVREREDEGSPNVFHTKLGPGSDVSFSFPSSAQRVEETESSPTTLASSSSGVVSLEDCQSPERPEPQMIKTTAVMAAAALCQLSSVGWGKEDEDKGNEKSSSEQQQEVNIVSP